MTTSQSPNDLDNKTTSEPDTAPTNNLLGELESLIDLLEDSTQDSSADNSPTEQPSDEDSFDPNTLDDALDIDIPILEDVVAEDPAPEGEAEDEPEAVATEATEEAEEELDLDLDNIDFDFSMPDFKLTTITEQTDSDTEATTEATAINESIAEQPPQAGNNEPVDIDLLIQEIVDDLIPTMEDQLRKRLSEATPEAIRQLARALDVS